ncbi:hypothetical protein [Nocardia sp. NBC_01329]|uniref:hypothetical protein n=1 Tax=Nocardia sp. NBC_01329 TaxID=2903594 RepID=UPI002E1276A3|nr:hypothetical protein OG405_08540 [Nocardia sp. NBC_01329]
MSSSFQRVALIASRSLGAVAMPAGMGVQVRQLVEQDDPTTALPIISYQRARREWVFLVGPPRGNKTRGSALAELGDAGIRILESGQRVWLPMTDRPMGWYWVSPPVSARALPSRTTVIAAAKRLTAARRSATR